MLQFITVSDVTYHFVWNITIQHSKGSEGCQSLSLSHGDSLKAQLYGKTQ